MTETVKKCVKKQDLVVIFLGPKFSKKFNPPADFKDKGKVLNTGC